MFKMKKVYVLFAILILTLSTLVGCGSTKSATGSSNKTSSGDQVSFNFYASGSLNVQQLWQTLIPKFEKANPNIKVNLVFVPAGQQGIVDRLLAANKAGKGNGGIDLMEAGMNDILRGQKENVWQTFKASDIPNIANVDSKSMSATNNQAVPYRASAVVLAYNSDVVKNPPKTLDDLNAWIKQHPGRFAYNDPSTGGAGDSFVQTEIYQFLPDSAQNSSDKSIESQWTKGFNLLKDLNKYVYGKGIYPKKNQGTLDLLSKGEVDMIPAWSDMGLEQIDNGLLPKSTKLTQITPGFTGGPAYISMPKATDANKAKAIYKFINFALSPDAQSVVVKQMHGFPGIKLSQMPQNIQDELNSVAGGYRIFNLGDLDQDIQQKWQREVAGQ